MIKNRAWAAAIGLWAMLGLGAAEALALTRSHSGVASVLGAVNWSAMAAVVPVQILSIGICALALRGLRPGAPYLACLYSRWLRDAGGNLLVFAPGIGEVAGVRALTLMGATTVGSVSASAMDVGAESLAQVPYAIFAVLVLLPTSAARLDLQFWFRCALSLGGAVALVVLAWRSGRIALGRLPPILVPIRRGLAALGGAFAARRPEMPVATLLHLVAWIMGGVQVWLAIRTMGLHVSVLNAVALESLVYAARAVLFIVPGGLGVQEASFVGAGLLFGLSPTQALSLSLVLRARDILIGGPALILWPVIEAAGAARGPKTQLVRRAHIDESL
ncbi:MAG: lysylphosphatidylglycerol synthase domain-containing protein [Caulobacterales bacterium]|jgi:hypothetical protein